jgi:hypothetical protein
MLQTPPATFSTPTSVAPFSTSVNSNNNSAMKSPIARFGTNLGQQSSRFNNNNEHQITNFHENNRGHNYRRGLHNNNNNTRRNYYQNRNNNNNKTNNRNVFS